MKDAKETSILIKHDDKTVLVDTTSRGMASTLLRRGFEEITEKSSVPYRRFRGAERQIGFRGATKRKVAQATVDALKKARVTKKAKGGQLMAGEHMTYVESLLRALKAYDEAAEKFLAKVEDGRARSMVTYYDLKRCHALSKEAQEQ